MHTNKIQFNAFILWEATNFCFWNIFWNLLFGLEKGKEGFFAYQEFWSSLPFSIKARWEVTFEGISDSSPKNIRFTTKKSPSTGVSW